MNSIPKEFVTTPIVYAVKNTYQIIVPVNCETVMWVQVGDSCFYDDSNGILRSASTTHRMTIPMELLDQEKQYKVCYRIIHKRKPYFTESSDVLEYISVFYPIKNTPIHIYHIADAHNMIQDPVSAGKYFGDKLDLLILNGDIPNHCGNIENFNAIHQIASQLTSGERPVVFSRGNHDMRGIYAEQLEYHTPTDDGRSYYTFRLGHLWGIVLDCGEDKADDSEAYGHTICCQDFRTRQTEYLKKVITNCKQEYESEGIKNRIVICHVPFTEKFEKSFNIEEKTYREWSRLLREYIHPQLMICGHQHQAYISHVGSEKDEFGQPCPVVVGSSMQKGEYSFVGAAIRLFSNSCEIEMTDQDNCILFGESLKFS